MLDAFTWGTEFNAWLQTFGGPFVDGLFKIISVLGSVQFYLVLIPLVYWCFDRRTGGRIGVLFLLSAYVSISLKYLFATPRPFEVAPGRVRHLVETRTFGFPSAHAMGSATVWGYLAAHLGRWLWVAGIGLPLLIGVSRMYLGVHSPADVLGGWAIGAGLVAVAVRGLPAAERRLARAGLGVQLALAIVAPVCLAILSRNTWAVRVAAALAGAAVGIVIERRYVRFSARGASSKRVLRFLVGAAVLIPLYLGLKMAQETVGPATGEAIAAARYWLAGFWVFVGGPLLFMKTGLARMETFEECAGLSDRDTSSVSRAGTVRLDAVEDQDSGLVGMKALSLTRMMRVGLPVPQGFCVTGAAYREHISRLVLQERVTALCGGAVDSDGPGRARALAELREAVADAPLPDGLAREVEERYRELGAKHVAVRSSAMAEDLPGHSFAGQYDTFLGVTDLADCIDAVKKCWASLWTERAFEYREKSGIKHGSVDMAVVVQELVPAEVSGVLFTADPMTGRADRMVVESCFGLGEALVSGKVTPDQFVLSKRKLRVIERTVSTKTVKTVLNPASGVAEKRVDAGTAGRSCLDDVDARRLGRLALKAEKAFGSPQDMEWAAAEGRLYVLQSRPITTLEEARRRWFENHQVWTNANTGEVVPDVVSPLTWSAVQRILGNTLGELFERSGFDLCGAPTVKLVAGRVYFNVNTLLGLLNPLWRDEAALEDTRRKMGGQSIPPDALRALRTQSEDIPGIKPNRLRMLLKLPGLIAWLSSLSLGRGELIVAAARRRVRRLRRADLVRLSEKGMLDLIAQSTLGSSFDGASWLVVQGIGMVNFIILDKICQRWFGEMDGNLAGRLVGGVSGVQSAEAGLSLWRLAELAGRHDAVALAVSSEKTFDALRRRISGDQAGAEFLKQWDAFMDEHGHHTRGELELANPRWAETPDDVLAMVRGHLDGVGAASPIVRQAHLGAQRRELTRKCNSRLRNPIKRIVFQHVLRKAQRGCRIRENVKSEGVKLFFEIRRILLALADRLVERDVLRVADDIFFLSEEEIEKVVGGGAGFDIEEVVARRRDEFERNSVITPPSVVVGHFNPDSFVPDAVDEAATTFEGIASSPGVVTGPARVVLRAGEDTVRPGEILVAPFTDPGWTPFFVNATGIVMDMGGLLSHGSIIAREYGIPAVVNVGPATKIVKTGQMLHVNGDRGRVRILGDTDRDARA